MSSPFIIPIMPAFGMLVKRPPSVVTETLQLIPELHFELISVLAGVSSVTIYYKGGGGRLAAEVFFFDADHNVSKAVAHYGV